LLGGDFPRTPRTRRVGQDFEDSFTEPVRLGAFPDAQRLPSISPPFPPHADLLPVQPDFLRNLLVQEPLNPPHQNQRTLHNPLRHRARPTEFLQNRQLLLANPDLCRCPWHSSPPWPHNRGFGRYTRIPDFLKPRFRVVELGAMTGRVLSPLRRRISSSSCWMRSCWVRMISSNCRTREVFSASGISGRVNRMATLYQLPCHSSRYF